LIRPQGCLVLPFVLFLLAVFGVCSRVLGF